MVGFVSGWLGAGGAFLSVVVCFVELSLVEAARDEVFELLTTFRPLFTFWQLFGSF
jgi:hypothetical protein